MPISTESEAKTSGGNANRSCNNHNPKPLNQPMDRPQVNPSPKTRFQAVNGHISAHRSMIELPAFDRAADAAMLEYSAFTTQQNVDGNSAMATGFKLQGAREFLAVFKTLAEQFAPTVARKDLDNLPDVNNLRKQ
jgi:hypothetical protein